MTETLEAARDAFERHAWAEAIDGLEAADCNGGLTPEDLERLGIAAWWTARPDLSDDALARAFSGYADAGRKPEAVRVAVNLAYQAFRGMSPSVGGGWLARVGRLLEDEPESAMHAWPALQLLTVRPGRRQSGSNTPQPQSQAPVMPWYQSLAMHGAVHAFGTLSVVRFVSEIVAQSPFGRNVCSPVI